MAETIVIETNTGKVRGLKRMTILDKNFFSFQGIPYAQTPVGELRFKDPLPVLPWANELDATRQKHPAPHFDKLQNRALGNEDALHLNVYTKELHPKSPLPVMVWIHGGGFMMGSSGEEFYAPDYLLEKDIVFASFNYRLGAFGFLSLEEEELQVPGNAGLKDQVMALKWLKANIAQFGGDPNNITLFGESAGATSVHYHMTSEISKGLFHKAILQSGTVVNSWSLVPKSNYLERLCKEIGYDGALTSKVMLEFLRKADPNEIVMAQNRMLTAEEKRDCVMFPFGPMIEPYKSDQCMIPTDPLLMMRNAWSKDIPILIGGTSDEGLLSYGEVVKRPAIITELTGCQNLVPLDLNLKKGSADLDKFGQAIKKFYFGDAEPSMDLLLNYIDIMSDKMFWHGIHRTVLSRLAMNAGPMWLFHFAYDGGESNIVKMILTGSTSVKGACHGDEICYLFKNMLSSKIKKDSPDFKTTMRLIGPWTSFAMTGNPNCDEIKPLNWEPLTSAPYKCYNISNDIEFTDFPRTKNMNLWDSFYSKDQLF